MIIFLRLCSGGICLWCPLQPLIQSCPNKNKSFDVAFATKWKKSVLKCFQSGKQNTDGILALTSYNISNVFDNSWERKVSDSICTVSQYFTLFLDVFLVFHTVSHSGFYLGIYKVWLSDLTECFVINFQLFPKIFRTFFKEFPTFFNEFPTFFKEFPILFKEFTQLQLLYLREICMLSQANGEQHATPV